MRAPAVFCALLLVDPAASLKGIGEVCAVVADCATGLKCPAALKCTCDTPAWADPPVANAGTCPTKAKGTCDVATNTCNGCGVDAVGASAECATALGGVAADYAQCLGHKCYATCQKALLVKCASTPGEGLLGDKASCNSCIVTNMAQLQLSKCTLAQMQSFCALAPDKAAAGATPVPEHNVCSQSKINSMWTKWEDYCKSPGPKAVATPPGCDKLISSFDAADPMKHAIAECEAQTGDHCYIFDLDGSRCSGAAETNIFNCRNVPDEQKRSSKPDNENWLKYCKAPVPKSYAMTDGCSKGFWDNSGLTNQKKAVEGCQNSNWDGSALVAPATCADGVGSWLDVCTAGKIEYDAAKCTKAKALKCKCAPYDVNGAGCAGTGGKYRTGPSAPSAPAPAHHHHHHHHGHHHKGGHYKAWDADEEVRAEGSGTASAYSYLPVACVAVAVLAGVAFVVRRRQASELPAAQAAGYGTVPP